MLRCPEAHEDAFLVLSTGEIVGRMVRSGLLGCPVCQREYPIVKGVAHFSASGTGAGLPPRQKDAVAAGAPPRSPDAQTLQALLDLSGPGGYVVLIGAAARHAVGLAWLMGGIHFVGINAPSDVAELPVLSLLMCDKMIPLRRAMARGVVVGLDRVASPWTDEALRVLLRGRRLVIEDERATASAGLKQLAVGEGLWVGEKT